MTDTRFLTKSCHCDGCALTQISVTEESDQQYTGTFDNSSAFVVLDINRAKSRTAVSSSHGIMSRFRGTTLVFEHTKCTDEALLSF